MTKAKIEMMHFLAPSFPLKIKSLCFISFEEVIEPTLSER